MFGFLFTLLLHPYTLIGLGVLIAIGVGLYFLMGPVKFIALICDIRLWGAVAGVLVLLAYCNVEKQNADLKSQVASAAAQFKQNQTTAVADAKKTTDQRAAQQAHRKTQTARLQEKIDSAPPGQAQDDVLDAIAAEDASPAAVPGGSQPQPGSLRKQHPDGTVEP